jgi:hypothetical protein
MSVTSKLQQGSSSNFACRVPMPGKSRLAKVARITAKIAAGLVAFVLLIVLVLFLVNSFVPEPARLGHSLPLVYTHRGALDG